VEGLVVNRGFWAGRRVLVTGHTGFKGGWLALVLAEMGAEVHGFALPPLPGPSLFEAARIGQRLAASVLGDLREPSEIARAVSAARPEVVFHLAAQALVRRSYREPLETFLTNVQGTAHLLEAVRRTEGVRAVVNVTSDKCYENDGNGRDFRESDPMGGHDPYSCSKGCAELVTAAYRRSFLAGLGVAVATARAGNVVGGGDFAEDRLIPDFLRAIDRGEELVIRSPGATRPWQHVMGPVEGYVLLAERLHARGEEFAGGWNFGPPRADARPVRQVVERLCEQFDGARWRIDASPQPYEAGFLSLESAKAKGELGWSPRWGIDEAIRRTADWHRAWRAGHDMQAFTLGQAAAHAGSPRCGTPNR
jgi:CDP-glucose 4,6-dehydratase